jgi:hypothetical protein
MSVLGMFPEVNNKNPIHTDADATSVSEAKLGYEPKAITEIPPERCKRTSVSDAKQGYEPKAPTHILPEMCKTTSVSDT